MSIKGNVLAQYLGSGDPALKEYYPPWLENMADDATVEGSMLDGVVVGAESVRSVVLTIKSLYDRQEFKFVGPYGDNGWIEDYVAEVHGEPLGCVVLIKRNDAGQTQHRAPFEKAPARSVLCLFHRVLLYRTPRFIPFIPGVGVHHKRRSESIGRRYRSILWY